MVAIWENWQQLMARSGMVMWPLLGLSIVAMTISFERLVFYLRTNRSGQLLAVKRMAKLLRSGEQDTVKQIVANDSTVYGDTVMQLLDEPGSESAAFDAVESQRHRLDRYLPILSTIITAAPMLGILGTVLGIIASFEALSGTVTASDPRAVGVGIAEALLTTAAGLVVALMTLFPYVLFRTQSHRTLSRLERLAAAAIGGKA
jgi:biopolymer transport protein ExbB